MVRLTGVEPVTHCLEGSCSIQLSYRRSKQKGKEFNQQNTVWQLLPCPDFRVGAVRFELTTPWSQTKCATAALRPDPKIIKSLVFQTLR